MYKSPIALFYRRVSMGLVLLLGACTGGDSGSGNYNEQAQENHSQTQHLEDDDITGDTMRNSHTTKAPTYQDEDPNMAKRKIEPLDSMSPNNTQGGQPTPR